MYGAFIYVQYIHALCVRWVNTMPCHALLCSAMLYACIIIWCDSRPCMSSVLYDIIYIVTLPRGFVAPTKVLILSYPRLNFSSRSPMYCTKIYGTREGSGRKKEEMYFTFRDRLASTEPKLNCFFFWFERTRKKVSADRIKLNRTGKNRIRKVVVTVVESVSS